MNLALRIELHHHARHLIDDPDVVLRINAHLLRNEETIRILADLTNVLAAFVELEKPRSSMEERPRRADGDTRMASARVNKNISPGIRRHATHFTKMNVGRGFQQIAVRIECDIRHRLSSERDGHQEYCEQNKQRAFHEASLSHRRRFCGLRFQHQFLNSPRFNFRDDDLIRVPAVEHVNNLESSELLARMPEFAEDCSI